MPVLLATALVLIDQGTVLGTSALIFLMLIYLPATFIRDKWNLFKRERYIRFAIYLFGAITSWAIYEFDQSIATERADTLVQAIEGFQGRHGQYPQSLDEVTAEGGSEVLQPCVIRSCGQFRYSIGQYGAAARLGYSESLLLFNTRQYFFAPQKSRNWMSY
jgi:hypothetical protein